VIRIGTCSWTEKSLLQSGDFYPTDAKTAEARLRYYAENFNTVEVDSSYYAIPDIRTAQLWADRTPDNFLFHIKVYGALTGHGIDPRTLPVDIAASLPADQRQRKFINIGEPELLRAIAQRFRDALRPLQSQNKLGLMVFQFSQQFHYRTSNMDYLVDCKELMEGLPVAVEFRHGSWLKPDKRDSVMRFLQEYQMIYVTADEPQYGSLATVPFLPEVTASIAYFRFHGRNKQNWLRKGIETSLRYDYRYSEEELMEFKAVVSDTDMRAKVTYAMFNNCHGSSAVRNAGRLKQLLQTPG